MTRALPMLVACILGGSVVACAATPPSGPDYLIEDGPDAPSSGSGEDDRVLRGTESDVPAEAAPEGTPVNTATEEAVAPKPNDVSAKVAGAELTVSAPKISEYPGKPGLYQLTFDVSGSGIPANSHFLVLAERTGTGCAVGETFVDYVAEGDANYMPKLPSDTLCGINIFEVPTEVGARFRGYFYGKLYSVNTTITRTKYVQIKFDVLRET
jgi:hypothetical protein